MTRAEFIAAVSAAYKEHEDEYSFIGVRFEDKAREVGEVITDRSRSNWDRDDEREFPAYGTPEYEELDELDGVSAYYAQDTEYVDEQAWMPSKRWGADDVEKRFFAEHCYVLGCSNADTGEDDGEIIVRDAVVLAVIF